MKCAQTWQKTSPEIKAEYGEEYVKFSTLKRNIKIIYTFLFNIIFTFDFMQNFGAQLISEFLEQTNALLTTCGKLDVPEFDQRNVQHLSSSDSVGTERGNSRVL